MKDRAVFDVTTFGEALLRLSVDRGYAFEEAIDLRLSVGGAEANVVSHLARSGHRTAWAGLLPDDMTGGLVAARLRAAGVDLGCARTVPGRLGLYFVEPGTSSGVTQVVYDRDHSVAAGLRSADLDWDRLLDSRVLLLSGITPALGDGCRDLVDEAIDRAHAAGVLVAVDLNYRARLWPPEQARPVLCRLVAGADVLLCSRRDARMTLDLPAAEDTELLDAIGGLGQAKQIALTLGRDGVLVADAGTVTAVPPGAPVAVLDGIGAGDAVTAGALAGLLDRPSSFVDGVRRGVRMAEVVLERFGDAPPLADRHLQTAADTGVRIDR